MKITWIGQGGLLFDIDGFKVLVDPYLSNSVQKIEPKNKRRVPVKRKFLKVKPNLIILTHSHLDHTDPETLKYYLKDETVTVLASYNAWKTVRETFKGSNNYVMFNAGTSWTENGVTFKAVYAEHSDFYAIGVIFTVNGKTYYVAGDTLYNEKVFASITDKIDYCFIPVNGRGNNMNFTEGKEFVKRLGATAIPIHCGLFDNINLNDFDYENKIVFNFYEEKEF
jgi:L-ascorbate 6-phosphate lactonase